MGYRYQNAAGRGMAGLLAILAAALLLGGCGNKTTSVRFKVNTAPEGAYVVYQMSGKNAPCAGEWIYIGNTPLQGVHQFSEEQLENSDKITLKVMQPGYIDQKKEWSGPAFYEESEQKGGIFWAPSMIPGSAQ